MFSLKSIGRSRFMIGVTYIIFGLNSILPGCGFKNFVYRLFGVKIGKGVYISPSCHLDNVYPHLIKIDDNCFLGWGVVIHSHVVRPVCLKVHKDPKHIECNVFIGGHSIIGAGCNSIGRLSIINGHSVVLSDVPPLQFWQGIPAKRNRIMERRMFGY